MKLNVTNLDAGKAGTIELSDAVFGIEDIRPDILQRCVVWQLAKRRGGNHKIKTRGEVNRTTKKMYKQKGTGGARHGARSAAQFVGGAKVFGPVVRSHEISLPKKVRALALRHALSSKAKAGTLLILDSFEAEAGAKTKAFAESLTGAGVKNALIIAGPEVNEAARLAARNIKGVDVLPNAGLNVYDVLRREQLVLTRSAIEAIEARFASDSDDDAQQEAA
jgi:large subunit ribosomal protein L4